MPEVVTMKFRRLLQVLLIQPTSTAQGEASIVATPFLTTGTGGGHRRCRPSQALWSRFILAMTSYPGHPQLGGIAILGLFRVGY